MGGLKAKLAPNVSSISLVQVNASVIGALDANHDDTWNVYDPPNDVSGEIFVGGYADHVIQIPIVERVNAITKTFPQEICLIARKVCPPFAVELGLDFSEKTMSVEPSGTVLLR
jgi:hypothetical protein